MSVASATPDLFPYRTVTSGRTLEGEKKGVAMTLIMGGVTLLVLGFVWFVLPTLRTFGHPAFEPVSRNDQSVYYAQSTGVEHAGI